MFDFLRTRGIPDDCLSAVSEPITSEVKNVLESAPNIFAWHSAYYYLFIRGYITGYIFGFAEVISEKACNEYNVKKEWISRWMNQVRVYKCVIQDVFGDTQHAQESRNIMPTSPEERRSLPLFSTAYSHGLEDGKRYLDNQGLMHHLMQAFVTQVPKDTQPFHAGKTLIELLADQPINS